MVEPDTKPSKDHDGYGSTRHSEEALRYRVEVHG
jgi:hypothetical protein